jgi:hypothetical protein
VLVVDHVPKDRDAPSSFAIGSQRKRAAVTGASYRVDTVKEPAKGRSGRLKLTVAKDRPGNRAKGTVAAMVDVEAGDDGALTIRLHLTDAQLATATGGRFRPTFVMEKVSRWLELHSPASRKAIYDAVKGKKPVVEEAIDVLIEEGHATVADGPRGARMVTSVRPFREDDELLTPVDNSARGASGGADDANDLTYTPPVPHLYPGDEGTGHQTPEPTYTHLYPPLLRGTGEGYRSAAGAGGVDLDPTDAGTGELSPTTSPVDNTFDTDTTIDTEDDPW